MNKMDLDFKNSTPETQSSNNMPLNSNASNSNVKNCWLECAFLWVKVTFFDFHYQKLNQKASKTDEMMIFHNIQMQLELFLTFQPTFVYIRLLKGNMCRNICVPLGHV